MRKSTNALLPPLAVGMASAVTGTIGLLLFFLPILGIPIAACGLVLGIAGAVTAALSHTADLRWSIIGIVVSCVALGALCALITAPQGYMPGSAVPRLWQSPSNRPYIPPPAAGRLH
jgi:hypothetical protein